MALFCACLILVANHPSAMAQQYHWQRTLPDTWTSIAFNPLSHGRVIFAGSDFPGGIVRSNDGGKTWALQDSVIDPLAFPIAAIHQIFVLPSDTSIVFAIGTNDFYRSTDGGLIWNDLFNDDTLGGQTGNSFGGIGAECMGYNSKEDALYYGEENVEQPRAGVWRSTDHGADWLPVGYHNIGIEDTTHDSVQLYSMDVSQDSPPEIIQSTQTLGSFLGYSSDTGGHWMLTFFGTENVETPKIVFSWNQVSPATGKHDVAIVQRWPTNDSSLVATTDGGASWQILNAPNRLWGLDIDQRVSMLSKPGDPAYPLPLHYFTGFFNVDPDTISNGMVQETTDGGISWHSINFPTGIPGNPADSHVRQVWVIKYDTTSGRLAVATDSGIYIGDLISAVSPQQGSQSTIEFSQNANDVSLTSPRPIASVRVFDLTGRDIFEASPRNTSFRIDFASFPHGVYAVEALCESEQPFRKLIIW